MKDNVPHFAKFSVLLGQTPRQIEIVNIAWERKKVTSEEIRKKFRITGETANQDFTKLLGLGLLVRKGAGRTTYYVLGRLCIEQ